MKARFILFRRGDMFYCEDTVTRKQSSLKTKDPQEAETLLHVRNEAVRQPMLNLQIARTYLSAADPEMIKRTWTAVMDAMGKTKTGSTLLRHETAMRDEAFDLIRSLPILETNSNHLLKVLQSGSVATNVFLRRLHNFAVDMNWLPWPLLAKKQWPKLRFKEKRAITLDEHKKIIARENNPEHRAFYELCWHLGGAQTDIANLRADDVDWGQGIITFRRLKTGTISLIRLGQEAQAVLANLPRVGFLFPNLQQWDEKHRSTQFRRRIESVNISGVTLHSYRYSWAERAMSAGYPERYAQQALGHNSRSVHRAYAKRAQVIIPPLEDFEKRMVVTTQEQPNVIPMQLAAMP